MKKNTIHKLIISLIVLLILTGNAMAEDTCPAGTQLGLYAGTRSEGRVFSYVNGLWSMSFDSTEKIIWSLGDYSKNNYLYAGSADGGKIYQYDGCEWKLSFDSSEVDIKAIEEYHGKLYASSGTNGKVFVFNGATWTQAFDPPDVEDRYGYTLKVYNDKLYYGTGWNGGTIYVFDGITWSVSTTLNPGQDFHVHSLEVYNNKLYAGTMGGKVYVFDGTTWSLAGTLPNADWIWSLKTFDGNLYAGTHPNGIIYRYNGVSWVSVYDTPATTVAALEAHSGKLYAGTTYDGGKVYVFTPGSGWSLAVDPADDHTFSLESACVPVCYVPACGDGIVNPGEECDDGNTNNNDACTNECKTAKCGDNFCRAGSSETCEPIGTAPDVSCVNKPIDSTECRLPGTTDACTYCGDGVKQSTEQCDDGNANNNDACTNECKTAACGDGIVQPPEECDDGNTNNNDACTNACTLPRCGDNFCNSSGETCEPLQQNTANDMKCPAGTVTLPNNVCRLPGTANQCTYCGDGILQSGAGEQCDDGNMNNADGCSSTCHIEEG
jgi:cysteine-rich repeat protein